MKRDWTTYFYLIAVICFFLVVIGNRATEAHTGLDLSTKLSGLFAAMPENTDSIENGDPARNGAFHSKTLHDHDVRGEFFQKKSDLAKIGAIMQAENILPEEWSFYAREVVTGLKNEKDVKNFADELKQKFPDWNWTFTSTDQKWEVTAVSPASNHHTEKLQFLATHTKQPINAYIIYSVTGKDWNESSAAFLVDDVLKNRLEDIFQGNPTVFSCMKGIASDKIDTALSSKLDQLLSRFDAKEIEALKEENFMSVSATSPWFSDIIDTKNNINLQIGIRSERLGGQTTVVVGTPIITIEY